PNFVTATKRVRPPVDPSDYAIRPEFKPQPGDVVITKQRASVFYGTPLLAHLTQLGIQTLIVCGESTSGCVRATAVDAYSNGFHVVLVEECCFDRSPLSHKVNLFDMHHKYTDVMHLSDVVAHLKTVQPAVRKAGWAMRALLGPVLGLLVLGAAAVPPARAETVTIGLVGSASPRTGRSIPASSSATTPPPTSSST